MRRRAAGAVAPAVAAALACSPSPEGRAAHAAGTPAPATMSTTTPPLAPDTLDVEALLPLVARVDAEDAELLRDHPATATFERLPFYQAGGLLRAQALLPTRPVVLRYAYDPRDRRLLPLGTPERVRAANAAFGLRLTPDAALSYLRYYLAAAGNAGWAGRRLAASADEVPWLPATSTDAAARAARAELVPRIPAARVEPAAGGGLRVTTATVRGQAIELVVYAIAADGAVAEERVTTVAEQAPVVQVL